MSYSQSAYDVARVQIKALPGDFADVGKGYYLQESFINVLVRSAEQATDDERLIGQLATLYEEDWQSWLDEFLGWGRLAIDEIFPDGPHAKADANVIAGRLALVGCYFWYYQDKTQSIELIRCPDSKVERFKHGPYVTWSPSNPPAEWIKGYIRWKGFRL